MANRITKFTFHNCHLDQVQGPKGWKPYAYLAIFEIACSFLNEQALGLDTYRLRLFPFSLEGDAVI